MWTPLSSGISTRDFPYEAISHHLLYTLIIAYTGRGFNKKMQKNITQKSLKYRLFRVFEFNFSKKPVYANFAWEFRFNLWFITNRLNEFQCPLPLSRIHYVTCNVILLQICYIGKWIYMASPMNSGFQRFHLVTQYPLCYIRSIKDPLPRANSPLNFVAWICVTSFYVSLFLVPNWTVP